MRFGDIATNPSLSELHYVQVLLLLFLLDPLPSIKIDIYFSIEA